MREDGWLGRFLGSNGAAGAGGQTLIGKVVSIDDSVLKLDFAAAGEVRTMEFQLERPLAGIAVGDHAKVTYRGEDSQNILERIEELRAH